MDVKLLSQFAHRVVTFDRDQRHLSLKDRYFIPPRAFHRLAPLVHHHLVAFVKPGYH